MGTLVQEITSGLEFEENDLGNPILTIGSTDYACIPSVNEMARDLETGGFVIDKMLTAIVRLQDDSGNSLYDSLPQAQQVLTYNGDKFRIINVKTHPTQTYLRITAMGITRGV
jgi:hypothetical protein